jgi:arginine deiminase
MTGARRADDSAGMRNRQGNGDTPLAEGLPRGARQGLPGDIVGHTRGADSEVGRLRSVLLHRPGLELKRITPRRRDWLLFDTLPWVGRAQQEHDALAGALRGHGVEVLYVTELLQDVLEYQAARDEAIGCAVGGARLGDELEDQIRGHLDGLDPESLSQVLIAGLTPAELRIGRGVVFELLERHDFVIDPLPNLMFSRDSSVWIGDRPVVTSMAGAARRRESALIQVIYGHHPRFAGTKPLYGPQLEQVEGGDILLLAPGVIAVGVGHRTTPAGLERLARRVFDAGLAHTVLAVPIGQAMAAVHLDTVCTVVDVDTVVMYPGLAYTLTAHAITPGCGGLRVSRPRPFLEAAARAMGIERLQVIGTGLDPLTAPREQWDDGANALAVDRRVAVCQERNVETNARLLAAGIEVITVPGSELGSRRGGPRCMACPLGRDPAAEPDAGLSVGRPARPVVTIAEREQAAAPPAGHGTVPPLAAAAPTAWQPELAPAG